MKASVQSLHRHADHEFSKRTFDELNLVQGVGVEGDAHAGRTVKHRARVAKDPTQPNLRQVHLIPLERLEALTDRGFTVRPGDLGENITTQGIDLHGLSAGTVVTIGAEVELEITGLRNPCQQIERFQAGLLREFVTKDESGNVIRSAGVMAVVRRGGLIRAGDAIAVALPPDHVLLEVV